MALARPLARLRAVERVLRTSATPTSPSLPYGLSSFSLPLHTRHFTSPTMSYTVRKIAQPYTLEHRVYVEKDGVPVSPFHDIPLYANAEKTVLNMVVEIPRWTNAKQEVSRQLLYSIDIVLTAIVIARSPRRNSSTPLSRTPRRASCASFATASPTRVTSGTTVPSLA